MIDVHGGTPPRSAQRMEAKDGTTQLPSKHDNRPPTYTEALWKAIAVTGTSNWVKEAGWAPKTPAWSDWLNEAEEAAIGEPMKTTYYKKDGEEQEVWTIRNWDSRHALSTLLRTTTDRFRQRTVDEANGAAHAWRVNHASQEPKEVILTTLDGCRSLADLLTGRTTIRSSQNSRTLATSFRSFRCRGYIRSRCSI
jgi:hypothetical protein